MTKPLEHIPEELLMEHLQLSERLAELEERAEVQNDFMSFVKMQWPDFIEGEHHKIMAYKIRVRLLPISCLSSGA